ncbi:hypothetical protein [Thermodesulfovibrio yellowstonii]|uniref:hypothetical protein n=1 Tax=Thermodesulfovibrio yellowstonii TaxID=28262 RepID=UPI003C7C25BC
MKRFVFLTLIAIFIPSLLFAWDDLSNRRPYKDSWGNSYKHYNNLYKDTDRDGVINYFDYNDRRRDIQTPYQRSYEWNYQHNYNKKYRGW